MEGQVRIRGAGSRERGLDSRDSQSFEWTSRNVAVAEPHRISTPKRPSLAQQCTFGASSFAVYTSYAFNSSHGRTLTSTGRIFHFDDPHFAVNGIDELCCSEWSAVAYVARTPRVQDMDSTSDCNSGTAG